MGVILLMPEQHDVYYLFYKIMFYLFYKIMFYLFYKMMFSDMILIMTGHYHWIMTGHYPNYARLRVMQNKCLVTCTLSTNHLIRIHVIIL